MSAPAVWYPKDDSKLSPDANYAIRRAYQLIYDQQNVTGALANQVGPQPLTASQITQVQNALQAGGSNPLNLSSLPGGTNTPVTADSSTTLAGLPHGYGPSNAGALYVNTYFGRVWRWGGTAWAYFDGSLGAGGIVATGGAAPSGGLWQACTGASVSCALNGATLASLTATAPSLVIGLSWWMRR